MRTGQGALVAAERISNYKWVHIQIRRLEDLTMSSEKKLRAGQSEARINAGIRRSGCIAPPDPPESTDVQLNLPHVPNTLFLRAASEPFEI
jgi:hypothetical protein